MRRRVLIPWKLMKRTDQVLRSAQDITKHAGLVNLAQSLGELVKEWGPIIEQGREHAGQIEQTTEDRTCNP